MYLDFTNEGNFKVRMVKYLEGVIELFTKDITIHASGPEYAHLF